MIDRDISITLKLGLFCKSFLATGFYCRERPVSCGFQDEEPPMYSLPDPIMNPFFRESPSRPSTPAALADRIAHLERKAACRARLFAGASPSLPARWFRPEPRPSMQYAGHMSTEAARDRRLTPQSKALLQVLRARCGNGTRTATCKTTLAHVMGVTTRSIGRYLSELVRFGYLDRMNRRGPGGLYIGLTAIITEKVLPCFRKRAWLAGWLAQNAPAHGAIPDRTELSDTNHSFKESSLNPERRPPG